MLKNGTFTYTMFIEHIRKNDAYKSITDVVMVNGARNLQIGGKLLKMNCPNISVMREV